MNLLARLVLQRPWLVLGVLLAITVAFAAFLPRLGISSDVASMVPEDDPVVRQLVDVVTEFGSQDVLMVVISGADVYRPETLEKAWRIAEELEAIPGVASVLSPLDAELVTGSELGLEIQPVASAPPSTPEEIAAFRARLARSPAAAPLVSTDGTALAMVVTLEPDMAYGQEFNQVVAPRLEAVVAAHRGPESVRVVGQPYLSYTISHSIRRDLFFLFPLAVLVVLASLYASFRTPAALVLPMVPVGMGLVWVLGLMAALGYRLSIVSAALPVLLVVVGSASGIHILSRYQGFRQQGLPHHEAVRRVVHSLSAALVMVSLTDAAGFASLVTAFARPVREFGVFTAVAVLFALLASLAAVPAILALREPSMPTRRAGGPSGATGRRDQEPGQGLGPATPWQHQARRLSAAMTRPTGVAIIAAGVLVALGLATGIPRIRIETNLLEYFGPQNAVVAATRDVERLFGGTSTLSVVVDTGQPDGVKDPALLERVARFQQSIAGMEAVAQVQSITDVLRQVNRALHADDPAADRIPPTPEAVAQELLLFTLQGGSGLDALVDYDYSKLRIMARVATLPTHESRALVEAIEAEARDAFAGLPVEVTVAGTPRIVVRLQERFVSSQLQSIALAFVVVAVIVALLMRSWRAGLLALMPLVLTVAVQFGVMGFAGIALDIATSMIAAITIGVGVDYGIHLISRYRQERRAGLPAGPALEATLASTGRAVAVNAVTLSAGFAVLIFSDFRAVSVLGLLLALTMLVSALATLLPLAASLVRVADEDVRREAGAAHGLSGGQARAGTLPPRRPQA